MPKPKKLLILIFIRNFPFLIIAAMTGLVAAGQIQNRRKIFLVLKFIVSDDRAEPKTHVDKEEAKEREGYEII